MVNHDLARFTMIMARVPWLQTLGSLSDVIFTLTLSVFNSCNKSKENCILQTSTEVFVVNSDSIASQWVLLMRNKIINVNQAMLESFTLEA